MTMTHLFRLQRAFALVLMLAMLAGPLAAPALAQTTESDPATETDPVLVPETTPPTPPEETPPAPPVEPEPTIEVEVQEETIEPMTMVAPETSDIPQPPIYPGHSCNLVSDSSATFVDGIAAAEITPNPVWSNQLSADNAKWVWTEAGTEASATFTRTFTVSKPTPAILSIAADNSYSVTLNGSPVGCANAGEFNYAGVRNCGFSLPAGTNTLAMTVNNLGGAPTESNPAGLYYRLQVLDETASCMNVPPKASVQICKQNKATEALLPGWQVYLAGPEVDSLSVPTNAVGGTDSDPLTAGMTYLATAMGTWLNDRGEQNLVDAEYSTTDAWATVMDGYTGFGPDILELQIAQQFGAANAWGPYNPSHTYRQLFTPAATGPVNFRIFDGTGTTPNPGWYGDNRGSLAVTIDEARTGTTGENGCVTLTDVPYGAYEIGEIAQAGWTLTGVRDGAMSIKGMTVTVDEPTESFTLVNTPDAPAASCVVVSDPTTIEGGVASFVQTFIHESWTALVAGAQWIWGDAAIVDPVGTTTQTFSKIFVLASVPSGGGTLTIAADNSFTVAVNGNPVGGDAGEVNYTDAAKKTIAVPASALVVGNNTLTITVTNMPMANGTAETNPAGLKYRLVIDGTTCTQPDPVDPEPEPVYVWIYKFLSNGDGGYAQIPNDSDAPNFPMRSSWDAPLPFGVGSGSYVLGNNEGGTPLRFSAKTSPMPAPADYTTYEVTTGDGIEQTVDDPSSPVLGPDARCEEGKYRLIGYKVGTSLEAAQAAEMIEGIPSFTDLTSDRHVIVINELCPGDEGGDPTPTVRTEVVRQADLAVDGPDAFLTPDDWFFWNDETNVVDNTLGAFVAGPATAPAGAGSAQMTVSGTQRRNLATYQFRDIPLADIKTLSFSTYSQSAGNGSPAAERSAYLNFNVSFTGADTWQRRLVYLPAANGAVVNDAWQTWDAIDSGNALWTWSGFDGAGGQWPDGNTSRYRTWNDLLAAFPDIQTRATDSWFGFRTGEPYADGFTGNVDRVIIRVANSSSDATTTFDFEPDAVTEQPPIISINTGGGGGGGNNNDDDEGEVLGASTEGEVLGAACPLLTDFMREGMNNNPEQVTLLQTFLNGELDLSLPTTGFFGGLTTAAVNNFQLKYQEEVLAPWAPFGFDPNRPTGYVFKTTLWKINDIACPELDIPFPQLP